MVTQKLQKYVRLFTRATLGFKILFNTGNSQPERICRNALTFACKAQHPVMKTLFLVRHAKSSWDNPGLRDYNRPLNDRGLHDAPRMGNLLHQLGIKPDLMVSSPAKRALTTAQFFAKAFGMPEAAIVQNPNIYEAYATEIFQIISELPETAQTVMLFGHNPTLTDVANRFSTDLIDNVPTCGVIQIASTAGSWAEFYEGNAYLKARFFPKDVL